MSREINFRYCPECAARLEARKAGPDGGERPVCPSCGLTVHPDPKVAACGLVVKNGRVLMLRRARPPARGRWCFPGGFADRGETLEQAAAREVKEETGFQVRPGSLFGLYSYPGYPIVVAIYHVEILEGTLRPNRESLEARWFGPDEIPWDGLAFPSTADALRTWVNHPLEETE